jgi:hypothetical protein
LALISSFGDTTFGLLAFTAGFGHIFITSPLLAVCCISLALNMALKEELGGCLLPVRPLPSLFGLRTDQ